MQNKSRTTINNLAELERKNGVNVKPIYLITILPPELPGEGMTRFNAALAHLKIIPIVRIGAMAPQWDFDPGTGQCTSDTGIVYDSPEQGAMDWFCEEAWPACTTADKHLRKGLPELGTVH